MPEMLTDVIPPHKRWKPALPAQQPVTAGRGSAQAAVPVATSAPEPMGPLMEAQAVFVGTGSAGPQTCRGASASHVRYTHAPQLRVMPLLSVPDVASLGMPMKRILVFDLEHHRLCSVTFTPPGRWSLPR